MPIRIRVLLVVVALVSALTVVAPARAQAQTDPPEGSIGIRLLDAPTNRANDPRAKLYIVDHLSPGTTINRRVEVSNGTEGSLTIPLYAAAATIENGAFRFGDGHAVNELTSWVSVEPGEVTIPAHGKVVATVTIAVPAKASEGERYGVVWAESKAPAPAAGGIAAVNRVGIRIYLSVGPGGEPRSDFEITDLRATRAADGSPVVEAAVRNTGKRALDLNGELQLSKGPAGLSAGPFPAKFKGTIAIGTTATAVVTLDKRLPAGPWHGELRLDSGLVQHSIAGDFTFPDIGATAPAASKSSGTGYVAGVVIALLVIAGVFLVYRRRSREHEESAA